MKRILSVLLVAAMLMAVLPLAAVSAATETAVAPAAIVYGEFFDIEDDSHMCSLL